MSYVLITVFQSFGMISKSSVDSNSFLKEPSNSNFPNDEATKETVAPTSPKVVDPVDQYRERIQQVADRKRTHCQRQTRTIMDDDKFVAALNCLRLTSPDLQLEYPSDAEEHLYEIRNAMAPWAHHAGHKIHSYIGLEAGPWVENYWIRNFEQGLYDKSDLCLSDHFGPFVPLFIPWVDNWVNNGSRYPDGLLDALTSVLRPNVLYITVSQNDDGVDAYQLPMSTIPNVLVLSAGGYGHVPVPLFAHNETLKNDKHPAERKYDLSYVGSMGHAPKQLRETMHEHCTNYSHADQNSLKYEYYQGPDWRNVMADSRFSLTPRGFGRTAFHLTEILQMGLIPIHLYSDIPWVPYADLFPQLGFINHFDHGFDELITQLLSMTAEQIVEREKLIVKLRDSHFSPQGAMDQIQRFMLNEENDLRCQKLPETRRDEH